MLVYWLIFAILAIAAGTAAYFLLKFGWWALAVVGLILLIGLAGQFGWTLVKPIFETKPIVQTVEGTPMPPVETQVGFPKTPTEVIALFNIRGITEADVTVCDFEPIGACWQIKVSPFIMDNPWDCWLQGFREIPDESRPGAYTHSEYSGVPPNSKDVLIDSGITIRSCEDNALAPTPGPLQANQPIGADIPGFPDNAEQAAEMLKIDLSVAGPWACGENNCFIFRPLAPNVSFDVYNGSVCWQDGLRLVDGEVRPGFENEPGATRISIPAGYVGPVEEIVFRPCEVIDP